MGKNLTQKIIQKHLVSGEMKAGNEIAILIDQTLTQDSTGTMTYLQFEAMGIPQVKTKRSVAYIDHNILQTGFENADDHKYIQSVAAKYGIYFSRPGNGICHQVHIERFGIPGMTLLGSDSHTPTCGGLGMLAIGAGGLDVAVAMAGGPYYLTMPKVCNVILKGKLHQWVTAKDIIFELLRRLTVKGGVGKIMEFTGDGVSKLSVPERATIANMGAELGATTSIFPSDEKTKRYLKAQGRENDWKLFHADKDAEYDETITIDLNKLVPLTAKPHSPDNISEIKKTGKIHVDQIAIGSCTNSSYLDLMRVAKILKGKTVHPRVSLVIASGSRQVLTMLAQNGSLTDLVASGARILESACGPCIGMGQAPSTNAVSLRTFNRNFEGRSGTLSARVYLVSPETAAVSAITGILTDPREYGKMPEIVVPENFMIKDNMIVPPVRFPEDIEIMKGPNIKPFPVNDTLPKNIKGKVLLKVGDNITTDHIMPSGAKLLPFRSNIPYLSQFCFFNIDQDFPKRALENKGGFIIGGSNYGQGSSREHAALVPLYLGIKGVIAKSFARIHMANLINSGIIPMTFENESDYNGIDINDVLTIDDISDQLQNSDRIIVKNVTKNKKIKVALPVSQRQKNILLEGGLLNYTSRNINTG